MDKVTASAWLERAGKHNIILPSIDCPMGEAFIAEMEEYAAYRATPAPDSEKLREALKRAADEFDLILMRLKDGQDERAAGAAICGARDARAALGASL